MLGFGHKNGPEDARPLGLSERMRRNACFMGIAVGDILFSGLLIAGDLTSSHGDKPIEMIVDSFAMAVGAAGLGVSIRDRNELRRDNAQIEAQPPLPPQNPESSL